METNINYLNYLHCKIFYHQVELSMNNILDAVAVYLDWAESVSIISKLLDLGDTLTSKRSLNFPKLGPALSDIPE